MLKDKPIMSGLHLRKKRIPLHILFQSSIMISFGLN